MASGPWRCRWPTARTPQASDPDRNGRSEDSFPADLLQREPIEEVGVPVRRILQTNPKSALTRPSSIFFQDRRYIMSYEPFCGRMLVPFWCRSAADLGARMLSFRHDSDQRFRFGSRRPAGLKFPQIPRHSSIRRDGHTGGCQRLDRYHRPMDSPSRRWHSDLASDGIE